MSPSTTGRRILVCLSFLILCLSPSLGSAQTTALFLDSQPGDPVGGGQRRTYVAPALGFTTSVTGTRLEITAMSPSSGPFVRWSLSFQTAAGRVAPGVYENVHAAGSQALVGMSVSGSGGFCSGDATGRFVVLEAEYGTDGRVLRFAADFEQHCNDQTPALFGAVRVDSTIANLTPFNGAYPRFVLSITPPAHGTVSGDGVNCGIGGTACTVDIGASVTIGLTATPEPGYVFLGWTGSCVGSTTVVVRVNGSRSCEALFGPQVPVTPRTVLRLDGEPGSIGGNLQETLAGAATRWEITNFGPSSVMVTVTRPDGLTRRFELGVRQGVLGPGVYEDAADDWWQYSNPTISASISNSGCSQSDRGRFAIYELQLNSSGRVERLAADLEHHCGDDIPALFAAIRYNSTYPDVDPFGGMYPQYELTVTRPAHGEVTGGTLLCGATGTQCSISLSTGGPVTLTAAPDAGYVFAGWSGKCTGDSTTTVVVNGPTSCTAGFEPVIPTAARMLLLFESEAGDEAGGGRRGAYSALNSRVTTIRYPNGIAALTVDGADGLRWSMTLHGAAGAPLAPGTYVNAREANNPLYPGLSVNCGTSSTGRFTIHEISFAQDGRLLTLAIDFEQHCRDAEPGLFGVFRFNSTVPGVVPFGGAYPDYRLTVSTDAGGRVTGGGIDCAATTGPCTRAYTGPAGVVLTAAATTGYVFTGWAGSCTGAPVTLVYVNAPKTCHAAFEPAAPTAPRFLLVIDSQPDESIGRGRRTVNSSANSRWTVTRATPGYISLRVEIVDGYWNLDFAAPGPSGVLVPGLYAEARRAPFRDSAPGLAISGSGSACNTVEGRFLVHEIAFAANGTLTRFSADFEQHCGGQDAGLAGAIRYASAVPAVELWDGAYPLYRLSIVPAPNGTVSGLGMRCGTGGTICEATRAGLESVVVEANADTGYVFAGWNGACAGAGPAASVRLYGARECTPLFVPVATVAPVTLMAVDFVNSTAQAQFRRYHSGNGMWVLIPSLQSGRLTVWVRGLDRADWVFTLVAPASQPLARGLYRAASTVSGSATLESSQCSQSSGTFVVHELEMAGTELQRLAVDFALSCGFSSQRTPMTGVIRYNSRITPRRLSWGTHLMIASVGGNGEPHVQGIDADARADGLLSFYAYDRRFGGGVAVAYGDVDGDGAADVVTAPGAGGGPHVRVLTASPAAAGQPPALREQASFLAYDPGFFGGVSVAVGDVTGDGIADIVTAPGRGGGPHVRVFQLQPGGRVVSHAAFFAYAPAFAGGVRVAVGDIDGDGVGEIITAPGRGGGPDVRVYKVSAARQVTLAAAYFAYASAFTGGLFVAAGDINGDGRDDIITGPDEGGGPHVQIVTLQSSGPATLSTFFAYDMAFTGGVRVGAADLDGDGRAEILTGAGPGGGPHVMAVRRADNGTLSFAASFLAYSPSFTGGVFIGGATR